MVEHHHTRRQILQRAGGTAVGLTSLGALLSACGSSDTTSSTAAASTTGGSDSGDAIKVGVLFSLSGNLSIAETSMKNATMLAIDELNARGGVGGRKLQPIVEDYASDFGVVVQKARKLVEQDRVAAVIGRASCRERV